MPNIFVRLFAYPILERELMNRIADRDAQITSLRIEVQELRDRLFLVRGVPTSGAQVTGATGTTIPAYRTGRQRLREMITPQVGILTAEDEKTIEDSLTQ